MSERYALPPGWRLEKLGRLAEYLNGQAFKPSDWGLVGLPIIRIEQINDPHATCDFFNGPVSRQHLVEDGDLLFSWSVTLTTIIWNRGPAVLNQHVFKVVPATSTDPHFLHQLLDFRLDELVRQTHGSTMKHITRSDLLPFEVAVPPLPEQQFIAEMLDSIDAAIQQSEALIAKLKLMKSGLLYDLVTRGVDENGELRDLLTHPEVFISSALGLIPRHWTPMRMEDFTLKIVDGVHKTPVYKESGVAFLTVENLTAGPGVAFEEARRIDHSVHLEFMRRADPKPGDVLVSKDGTLGVARTVPCDAPDFSIFVSVAMLRPSTALIVPEFVRAFFETHHFQRQLGTLSAGTGLRHIHLEHFRKLLVPIPPIVEQERILSIIRTHNERLLAEESLVDKLRRLKKGLMHDLLTGRVRVATDPGFARVPT